MHKPVPESQYSLQKRLKIYMKLWSMKNSPSAYEDFHLKLCKYM